MNNNQIDLIELIEITAMDNNQINLTDMIREIEITNELESKLLNSIIDTMLEDRKDLTKENEFLTTETKELEDLTEVMQKYIDILEYRLEQEKR